MQYRIQMGCFFEDESLKSDNKNKKIRLKKKKKCKMTREN